ncbi:uncharacterized protein [Cicer arietinum]|uniref:Protein E6 n=1 Tax=Cicer arietinum TaxID=3827 RepID=A0A1S2X9T4_CICAR|nr:protein E6 [Cicer arietinum]
MAPFSNYISFLFLTTLLFALQITARDSQFFSKVTHSNNNKETEIPNKEEPITNKPDQQQPHFIPETENSYGLYGHDDSDQLPSTTTATYHPSKTQFEDTNKYNNKYYNNDAYNTKYYNKDTFENNQNEFTDEEYNSMVEKQNNDQNYYNNNNNAASERSFHTNNNHYHAANNRYNGEKQGMSDTRFLEGGKYFYDVNYEKNNNPTFYSDSFRGMNANNRYNNRGNNYDNNNEYYNHNKHGSYNAYKNQEEFEDEQNEFEP